MIEIKRSTASSGKGIEPAEIQSLQCSSPKPTAYVDVRKNCNARYALGFWAEALWHLCREFPDHVEYRGWYEKKCVDLEFMNMGLPLSSLGGNAEMALTHPTAYPA